MPVKKDPHPLGKPGKHKAKHDDRTLNFANFVSHEHLPLIPKAFSWSEKKKSRWGAMKNINIHDCTCAAAGHLIQTWSMHTSGEVIVPTEDIIEAYSAVSGYDPETNKNDDGAAMLDVLKLWRKKGVGGHKIKVFASIDPKDRDLMGQTIFLCGGVYGGLELPRSILKQKKIWDLTSKDLTGDNKPGSYGGHAVTVLDYNRQNLTCISWGKKQKMTWRFWNAYADEAYVTLSDEFLNEKNIVTVISVAGLSHAIKKVTGEDVHLTRVERKRIAARAKAVKVVLEAAKQLKKGFQEKLFSNPINQKKMATAKKAAKKTAKKAAPKKAAKKATAKKAPAKKSTASKKPVAKKAMAKKATVKKKPMAKGKKGADAPTIKGG
jgi:hypothetical protein